MEWGVDLFKTIANVCLVLLAVIAGGVCCVYVYYHFCIHDTTLGVNYIDNQVGLDIEQKIKEDKDLTEEEINELEDRYFLEVNYYSNKKNNGIELQELKLNYFTDYELGSSAYRSTGMQYVGNYQGLPLSVWDKGKQVKFGWGNQHYGIDETSVEIANSYVDKHFYYYDSANDVTFNGATNNNGTINTELKRSTPFIVKIDGRAFEIKLDKYFDRDEGDVRCLAGYGWKVGEVYNRYYYTYGSLFQSCLQATKVQSAGEGTFYVTVDLSSLFSIKEYDLTTGKFKADDVTDVIKNYAVMKFTYNENGARNSTQSMFGIIENSPKYDIEKNDIDTSYWQERVVYTLTNKYFDTRYSEVYNGYFVSLNIDTKNLFETMPRAKVHLKIDTLFEDKKIVGIDYNGFENLEIDTLTISGSGDFYLLDKALSNTSIKIIKHSSALNLDIADSALNNDYEVVIL